MEHARYSYQVIQMYLVRGCLISLFPYSADTTINMKIHQQLNTKQPVQFYHSSSIRGVRLFSNVPEAVRYFKDNGNLKIRYDCQHMFQNKINLISNLAI